MNEMEAQVRALLRASGLGRLGEHLEEMLLPSLRLRAVSMADASLTVGASKLSGDPDLPEGVAWPQRQGKPLAFIAQIDLAEVASSEVASSEVQSALPASGVLSFFYDAEEQPCGGEPGLRDAWQVLHFDDVTDLQRRNAPLDLGARSRFRPCGLTFAPEITVPPFESPAIEERGFTWDTMYGDDREAKRSVREEGERLIEVFRRMDLLLDRPVPLHRLLGHPDAIQGDMQQPCQLASHGGAESLTGAKEWQLLLQVDSDDATGMQWGDLGRIYYWIERDALARREFSRAWVILECS